MAQSGNQKERKWVSDCPARNQILFICNTSEPFGFKLGLFLLA